jgi:uncharacterized protein
MSQEYFVDRLDIKAFANSQGTLAGKALLSGFERLLAQAQGQEGARQVAWTAHGEMRTGASGDEQCWLHVQASLSLPQTCQRCLSDVDIPVRVARDFRFVATEAQAEAEDEEAEEDVLAWSQSFDLLALIEDELLMALPLVPLHEVCPTGVTMSAQDADFEPTEGKKHNPFAVLANFQTSKSK